MDREITVEDGWQKDWLDRSEGGIQMASGWLAIVLSLAIFSLQIYYICSCRRCAKDMKENPSNRTALVAQMEKCMAKAMRSHWYIASILMTSALGVWIMDAILCMSIVYDDVSANPQEWDNKAWLDLAVGSAGMLAIFTAVFFLFPMLQMMIVARQFAKAIPRETTDGTLSAYITLGRFYATELSLFWMLTGFWIVTQWPVFEYSTARLISLEATFGSGLAWLHASYILNFRTQQIACIEVQSIPGVREGVMLYGKQSYVAHFGKSEADVLPQRESEQVVNEKTGLL